MIMSKKKKPGLTVIKSGKPRLKRGGIKIIEHIGNSTIRSSTGKAKTVFTEELTERQYFLSDTKNREYIDTYRILGNRNNCMLKKYCYAYRPLSSISAIGISRIKDDKVTIFYIHNFISLLAKQKNDPQEKITITKKITKLEIGDVTSFGKVEIIEKVDAERRRKNFQVTFYNDQTGKFTCLEYKKEEYIKIIK